MLCDELQHDRSFTRDLDMIELERGQNAIKLNPMYAIIHRTMQGY